MSTAATSLVAESSSAGNGRTLRLEAYEQRQAGQISGCGLQFTHAFHDTVYRDGGLVLVSGSVELMRFGPQAVSWTIKFKLSDVMHGAGTESPNLRPFTPTNGWVTAGRFDSTRYAVNSFQCENGAFCVEGIEGAAEASNLFTEADSMRFGIQRVADGIDATTEVVLVNGPEDIERQTRAGRCLSDLTRAMRAPG